MTTRIPLAASVAAALVCSACFSSPAAPRVHIRSFAEMPVVTMKPYDETANANINVDAALARAKKSGKRVLVDLGGNWCTDCIIFANLLELPEVKAFVDAHYEVAMIDVGRFDRNLDIPRRFGVARKIGGVPSVLILTGDGKLLDGGHIEALADARHMTPQAIADWLAKWAG